ncbi:hypothetical protein Ahy_B05g078554 [Arachis hypogaea]|uniref:Protein FAR1-RELATED SEQUENCE n=1 Tax=Arachis hypogaea TaxID=3818 RepID=A0A444Z7D4_ARAHY|nr:hypothetical protein Ahy_B05g078554 [Arachis hypogaea]
MEYVLTFVNIQHNHAISPSMAKTLRKNRELSLHAKRIAEINDQTGVTIRNTYQSLATAAGGYDKLTFTQKDLRNHVARSVRVIEEEGDAQSLMQYFHRMQEENNFFYEADARSRAAYEYFGDVVSFDTTYLTNRSKEAFESSWTDFINRFNLLDNNWLAGMSSTQRSESMHSFMKGYLTSKSKLQQFVTQYDNCLTNKAQQEYELDAASFNTIIPCATTSAIEKQFQKEYTHAKFNELQKEFRAKANWFSTKEHEEGYVVTYMVIEEIENGDKMFDVTYKVEPKASSMDNVDNQNSKEVDENANDLEINNPNKYHEKVVGIRKGFNLL